MPRTFSLRSHILLLVLGTVVPALVVAAFLVRRVVDDNRQAVESRLIDSARAASTIVDAELVGTVRALQGLAESDRLAEGDLAGFYAQAKRLSATQPTWAAVSLASADGRQLLNTSRAFGADVPAVVDQASFEAATRSRQPAIGNLRRGQITQQPGFLVRVPVVRSGGVVYVVSAWITSYTFAPVLASQPAIQDEWVRGVIDESGTIVSRSRDAERFIGQKAPAAALDRIERVPEDVYRDRALDGELVYSAYTRAPYSGWIVGVAVPAQVIDRGFQRSMAALIAVGLLLLGAGAGGTYVISRRISREIAVSTREAEAIAGGQHPSHPAARVTEVRRLLDALARSAALLDTRQKERDEEVRRADRARDAAEAADRAKDEFLAMLGHELRNPLAPALTALHVMQQRGMVEFTRERDVVERQIRHMARLVDDLLDVSRLRRGAIELRREQVDLADVVSRAVEMTAPLVAEKRHQLDVAVAPGLAVDGDPDRLAQVFANLLSNAAKYTGPNGRIAVRARREGAHVVCECTDNGIGIASELLPRIFDLFVQGQRGLDRRYGGLGLGLAVARTLAELHGGELRATSPGAGLGSTFTVRLPASMEAHAAIQKAEGGYPRIQSTGPVLVVDDNIDALNMVVEALTLAGVETLAASSPAEALAVAARIPPTTALLDIGLPGMNGLDLGRALRSLPGGGSLRLIALTGYGQDEDLAASIAAGFDAFFVKPVEVSALLAAIDGMARQT